MSFQSVEQKSPLTPTRENYLRALYQLQRSGEGVRLTDLANMQKVRLPTARHAVNCLREVGLVQQENYGKIVLTETGKGLGREICERFELTRQFLIEVLGCQPEVAEREACSMEHHLDEDTLERIAAFVKHVLSCNQNGRSGLDCIANLKNSVRSRA